MIARNDDTIKEILVRDHPVIAAELFYHFDDREIGDIIVHRYATHQAPEFRELAVHVRDVLTIRSDPQRTLRSILGMHSAPSELLEELDETLPYEHDGED